MRMRSMVIPCVVPVGSMMDWMNSGFAVTNVKGGSMAGA